MFTKHMILKNEKKVEHKRHLIHYNYNIEHNSKRFKALNSKHFTICLLFLMNENNNF